MHTTTAVVTGHSRGLGAAIAAQLLQQGVPVLGLSRRAHADLRLRFPDLLDEVLLDLADAAAVQNWLAGPGLRARLQGVPVLLVNNAGVLDPIGPLPMQGGAAIARAVAVNVAAPLMIAAAVASQFL